MSSVLVSENRLLACLPESERDRLSPLLEAVHLPVRKVLNKVRMAIDYAYFPTNGIVSAMTVMEDGSAIEVATIGNEGMIGLTALMGGRSVASPYEIMVQVAGDGLRMSADVFRREAGRGGPFRDILAHYHSAFAVQVSYSVACNGLHSIEKRCCRWLLMSQDRVGSNIVPLTHEFLAIMLGVRRASVTDVLHPLQMSGMIANLRGKIEILDRPGLEAMACECYRIVHEEFERLFIKAIASRVAALPVPSAIEGGLDAPLVL